MSRSSPVLASAPTSVFLLHIGSMDNRLIGLSIERHWKQSIRLAPSLDEANVVLVDHDRPGIDEALSQLASRPGIGIVGYAFRPESLQTRFPHHLTLGKPLNLDILPSALNRAALFGRSSPQPVALTQVVAPESNKALPRTGDDEPELCGSLGDIPLSPAAPLPAKLFFEPNQYLVGHLARALEEARKTGRPHVVSGLPRLIGVHPLPQPICVTSFRDTQLRPFSMAQLPEATARVVNALTFSTSGSTDTLHTAEDFLWNIAAWAARGRLPAGTDPYRPVRLRAWPNFTRTWAAPHALRIVALWTREWASPVEIASRLKIPQRYVFSVYTSARFAGLLQLDAPADTSPSALQANDIAPANPPQRPSILSRILRKLLNAV